MKSWPVSFLSFAPLAGLGYCPPLLRFHLPFICLGAWTAWVLLLSFPRAWAFGRTTAALMLAYCWLGIPRLPWKYDWDGPSYWIGLAVFPAFAAGLRTLLRHLLGSERADGSVFVLLVLYFFPLKALSKLAGAELPPTMVGSPMALAALVLSAMGTWRFILQRKKSVGDDAQGG